MILFDLKFYLLIKRILIFSSVLFFTTLSVAQTPTEVSFQLLNSKDPLSAKLEQLYSYRLRRNLSDQSIAEIAQLGEDYQVASNRQSIANETASVLLSLTPKKDSLKPEKLYFLMVKEDQKWKLDNYTLSQADAFDNHFETLQQALSLYRQKDYDIDSKSKKDIEWELSRMGPKRLFSKSIVQQQHGIAISLALNNNFSNKPLRARDLAYAIDYYKPSKTQLNQLEASWAFALASIESNIEVLKPQLKTLKKALKRAQPPEGNIRKWLDQLGMDWAMYGVDYVDSIGFVGYCDGCFDLSFAHVGSLGKGLLYIPNKKKLPSLGYQSYLTLIPLEGAWYYYTTF